MLEKELQIETVNAGSFLTLNTYIILIKSISYGYINMTGMEDAI
jgi:hypothetical protein